MSAVPTEQAEEALAQVIAQAWLANADEIYPQDQESPDSVALAKIAARASWAFFLDIVDEARRNGRLR